MWAANACGISKRGTVILNAKRPDVKSVNTPVFGYLNTSLLGPDYIVQTKGARGEGGRAGGRVSGRARGVGEWAGARWGGQAARTGAC